MRSFAIMLILANLAAWGVQLWRHRDSAAVAQSAEEFRYEQAGRELELLDTARASSRESPFVTRAVQDAAAADAAVIASLPEARTAPSISEMRVEAWCGISPVLAAGEQAVVWLESWKQIGGQGQLTSEEEPVSSTWWVHLPPFANEADARVVLKELQDKKIDSFYMRTGELVGGISLGVFAIRESAFLVQADMIKRGYRAEVKEVQKMVTRARVSARLPDRGMLEQPDVQALLRNSAPISLDEIPCE